MSIYDQVPLKPLSMMIGTLDYEADRFLKVDLNWKGQAFNMINLYCPLLDSQPIGFFSNFRQCGFNYHLNFNTESGELSTKLYPWWPVIVNKKDRNGINRHSYVKCSLNECLYIQRWIYRFHPYTLFWPSCSITLSSGVKRYKPLSQLTYATLWLYHRHLEYLKIFPDDEHILEKHIDFF